MPRKVSHTQKMGPKKSIRIQKLEYSNIFKKSFSWLGRKVNQNIDAYGHNADDSGTDLCQWLWDMTPRPGKTSRHSSVF